MNSKGITETLIFTIGVDYTRKAAVSTSLPNTNSGVNNWPTNQSRLIVKKEVIDVADRLRPFFNSEFSLMFLT